MLVELMESSPAMVEKFFSSGVATEDAMVSGAAARQIGADRNGWEVDGRQVTYGKGPVSS